MGIKIGFYHDDNDNDNEYSLIYTEKDINDPNIQWLYLHKTYVMSMIEWQDNEDSPNIRVVIPREIADIIIRASIILVENEIELRCIDNDDESDDKSESEDKVEDDYCDKVEDDYCDKVEDDYCDKAESDGEDKAESDGEDKAESDGEDKAEDDYCNKAESDGEDKAESDGENVRNPENLINRIDLDKIRKIITDDFILNPPDLVLLIKIDSMKKMLSSIENTDINYIRFEIPMNSLVQKLTNNIFNSC